MRARVRARRAFGARVDASHSAAAHLNLNLKPTAAVDRTARRPRDAMSNADDEFDDARNTFYDDGDDDEGGGGDAREHTLEGALRPHDDQHHDEFASDGSDGEDDSELASEEESDGEDLMNDMERCVVMREACGAWCLFVCPRARERQRLKTNTSARTETDDAFVRPRA